MNAQWGTFYQAHGMPVSFTLETAQSSLQNHGYKMFNSVAQNERMVMGGLGDVIVQVTASSDSHGTYVIVSAFSEAEPAAEQARNLIRQDIQNATLID
jgi:hypothetical protein